MNTAFAASDSTVLPPPAEPLLRLLTGFQISQVLLSAHKLKVFQTLEESPANISEACTRLGLPLASGGRLLQTCVSLGLLEWREGALHNSSMSSAYLTRDKNNYLGGFLDYYQDMYYACGQLMPAILENKPQVHSTDGQVTDVFSAMEKEEALTRRFLGAMHSLGLLEGERLVSVFPEQIHSLLDLGGGSGALSIALAKAFPSLHIRLFDRPTVCPIAREYIEAQGVQKQIDVMPGDFWKDPWPGQVDAILLSMILHDWDFASCLRLLRLAANALPSGAPVLIYEQLLNEDRCGPVVTCLTNLTMLLRTASGAEYTATDYHEMLAEAGFSEPTIYRTSGIRHLIVARKL